MKNPYCTNELFSSQSPTEEIINNGSKSVHMENNHIVEDEGDFMDWDDDWFIDGIEEVPVRSSLKVCTFHFLSLKIALIHILFFLLLLCYHLWSAIGRKRFITKIKSTIYFPSVNCTC